MTKESIPGLDYKSLSLLLLCSLTLSGSCVGKHYKQIICPLSFPGLCRVDEPVFPCWEYPWSSRKQEIRSARSQCQQGTVASATVSLDKETQSQKHWAACSLGHRLSLLGYRNFVYCPECHDLLVCQKQALFSHQNVQFTWAMWNSKKNHPDSWQQQPTLGFCPAMLGSPLWLPRLHRARFLYNSSDR